MKSLKAALNVFVTRVTKSVGVYTAVIGIFLYHVILDKDFACTCEEQTSLCWSYMIFPACMTSLCWSYMILPIFIILVMLLWLDGSFQVLLKYSCLKGTRRFCCFLWLWIFRAVFIGLLWPISVLIDGDWFTCCGPEKKLYCRNQTADDQNIIKELKNESRVYGFIALLGIVLVAAILWPIPWRKCCCWCGSKECCPCCKSSKCYACCCLNKCCIRCKSNCINNDVLFEKIVLEEDENVVTDKLIEAAKEKINEKLNEYVAAGEWGECCYVVEDITENPPHQNDPEPAPHELQRLTSGSSPNEATTPV